MYPKYVYYKQVLKCFKINSFEYSFQPERIDPQPAKGYDVRSDVWSLGITLMEVATGHFPYKRWSSVFDQLHEVVNGDPPRLSTNHNANVFTAEFVNFVNSWYDKFGTELGKFF